MRQHLFKSISLFAIALTAVSAALGQSVYWSPSSGTLQQGKANSIDLFYDSCEPTVDPDLPRIDNLSLAFRGRSSSRSLINGRLSSKVIFNYQAIPSKLGQLTIPSIRVQTSEGEIQVPAARFEVVEATVGNTGLSPSEVFLSLFQNRDEKIYQGEVFELEYVAGAKQDYQLVDLSAPTWNPKRLVTAGLVDSQVQSVSYKGDTYTVKLYRARAMATESGIIEVPGATQGATVQIGRRRDFMFQEPVYDSFAIESDPFALEILPLPEGAPASFKGAVGEFTLESRVVPEQVQVGEPVTWTLELSGEGNWPAGIGVPPRSVSSRFRAIQPEVKNEFAENDLFTGKQIEDIVLIPTEEGTFEFGPVEYTYFDPKAERYKTITIPPATVKVTPAQAVSPTLNPLSPQANGSDAGAPGPGSEPTFDLDPTGQNTAEKLPEILKEPLATLTVHSVPQATRGFLSLVQPTAIAVGSSLAFWLALALAKSVSTDPRRSQRQALARLRSLSSKQLPADPASQKQRQLEWREAAAAYFLPETKEPTSAQIAAAARKLKGEAFAQDWANAWKLSDQILFGRSDEATEAWQLAQRKAVGATPGKPYSPRLLLRSHSWLPAIVLLVAFIGHPTRLSAQEQGATAPLQSYLNGDFKAAQTAWMAQVNADPQAFEPRYNAGLAAAQNDDWATAWGLWVGAFCLDPSNESVAWNLRIAHQNTSAFDPVLQSLLEKDGLYAIVRLASPAQWTAVGFLSLCGLGILLCAGIAALYWRPAKRIAGPLFALALLCGVSAYFSEWARLKYAALGEPDTLLVIQESRLLSIPTDLQEEQVSSTVGVGAVAKKERSFLGWIRIALPNGDSGWIRQESAIPLYGEIPLP